MHSCTLAERPTTQPTAHNQVRRNKLRVVSAMMLAMLGLEAAVIYAWITWSAPDALMWSTPLVACLLIAPCFQNGWRVVESVIAAFIGLPTRRARLDIGTTIPDHLKTLVVYPVMISDTHDIDLALECITRNRRTAPHRNLGYVIAADLPDRQEHSTTAETKLHRELLQRIDALNTAEPHTAPVAAVVRRQAWNQREKVWMGWERKRGNILNLCATAAGESESLYHCDPHARDVIDGAKYVMVLDNGTLLHARTIADLLGVLAEEAAHGCGHPTCRARTVIAQPTYRVWFPPRRNRYQRMIFPGYRNPGPEQQDVQFSLMQQLLDRDRYGGQAMIAVEPYVAQMREGAIPENIALGHDKLEATYVRSRYVTDAIILGKPVTTYFEHRTRLARWIRGDIQHLPWILGVQSPPGGIDSVTRLAMLLDVAIPVSDIAAVGLLLASWGLLDTTGALLATLAIALFTSGRLFASIVFTLLRGLGAMTRRSSASALPVSGYGSSSRPVHELDGRNEHPSGLSAELANRLRTARGALHQATSELVTEFVQLIFLIDRAVYSLKALSTSLWRLYVTQRKLLEWQHSAAASRALAGKARTQPIREMWPGALLGALALIWCAARGEPGAFTLLVTGMWALAPLAAMWLSDDPKNGKQIS